MNYYFLKIEGSTGTCYEHSKEPKEGFERKETKSPTGDTVISYRRYLKEGVFGRLTAMYEKEFKMPDDRKIRSICVVMTDFEDQYTIEFPLVDVKMNISTFAESFIGYMPSLIIDKAYRFFPYAIEDKTKLDKNGKARKNFGISMLRANLTERAVDKENRPAKLSYEGYDKENDQKTPGDIPLIDWEEGFDGNLKPNKAKRNKYLYDVLKEYSVTYAGSGGGGVKTFDSTKEDDTEAPVTTQEQKQPKKEAAKTKQPEPEAEVFTAAAVDDDDDLPF